MTQKVTASPFQKKKKNGETAAQTSEAAAPGLGDVPASALAGPRPRPGSRPRSRKGSPCPQARRAPGPKPRGTRAAGPSLVSPLTRVTDGAQNEGPRRLSREFINYVQSPLVASLNDFPSGTSCVGDLGTRTCFMFYCFFI